MTDSTRLVLEMSIGMFLYTLILGILAAVFHGGLERMGFALLPVLLGLLCGFLADVFMLIHMAHITERAAASMDESYANKTTVVQSMIRRVVFIAALFFLGSRPQIDAVAMIIGALPQGWRPSPADCTQSFSSKLYKGGRYQGRKEDGVWE